MRIRIPNTASKAKLFAKFRNIPKIFEKMTPSFPFTTKNFAIVLTKRVRKDQMSIFWSDFLQVDMQTFFSSPRILGLIPLSQFRKFLRCASLQTASTQIASPQIFHHRTRMKRLFSKVRSLVSHSIAETATIRLQADSAEICFSTKNQSFLCLYF